MKFFSFQSLLPSKNKDDRLTLFLIYSEAAGALGPEQPHSIFVSSLRRRVKGRKMTAMGLTSQRLMNQEVPPLQSSGQPRPLTHYHLNWKI